MSEKSGTSGDIEIEKHNLTTTKILFFKDVNNDKILITLAISSSKKNYKYFVGYLDGFKIKPLDVLLITYIDDLLMTY